jgi:dienelactone hydrolase
MLFFAFSCIEQNKKTTDKNPSIKTEEVTYSVDGTELKGFLAYDENQKGKKPGVIVVHEWWGNNDYSRRRAKMLAEIGYVALAVDMYGNGKQADNPKDAGNLAGETMSNIETAKAKFEAGVNFLKEQPQTDSQKIAAIGYCFGGGVVLNMALLGLDLNGVVSFHGSLPDTVVNPTQVKAKILVCTGAADPFVPKEQVDKFENAMKNAKVNYKVVSYPDALHAFTNPAADSSGKKFNIPIAYNKEADEKSWREMKEFLKGVLSE